MKQKHWIMLEWFLLAACTTFIPFDLIDGDIIGLGIDALLGSWTIRILEDLYNGEEY